MANKFQVEIQETLEELEHRLERAITAVCTRKMALLSLWCKIDQPIQLE